MDAVIRSENLTKFYGDHMAITDVNLEVREGEVFGYRGPNGAGKTTTAVRLHPTRQRLPRSGGRGDQCVVSLGNGRPAQLLRLG